MGVLNFAGTLHHNDFDSVDVLSLAIDESLSFENSQVASPRTKRKRSKSGFSSTYDFRDYGVDARRKGAKHERRKQNLHDLIQFVGEDIDHAFEETSMTAFAELFLDSSKMKVWEDFINLPDDQQEVFFDNDDERNQPNADEESDDDDLRYLLVDKKIRDMLRSKQLADNGLLRYYEDDVLSCMEEEFPSVLIVNLQAKYDRMLIYAICQYLQLSVNRVKLKDHTLIEIDLQSAHHCDDSTLTDYLKRKFL